MLTHHKGYGTLSNSVYRLVVGLASYKQNDQGQSNIPKGVFHE